MSPQRIRVLRTESTNPWFNLATEDWIYRELDPEIPTLFLWRNQETVVIGRSQNPWIECRLDQMKTDGVILARRQSGGGAVFHDLGNTNFTFLTSRQHYDRSRNLNVILKALEKRYEIRAEASGRNDMVVPFEDGPRKFSGSAFRESRDRAFHHGTLLISANLDRLSRYLTPDPRKIVSKGRASVRSRVVNLMELNPLINHQDLCHEIIQQFFKDQGSECEVEFLDPEQLQAESSLMSFYEKSKSWDWNYGESPQFTHQMENRFLWGGISIHLDSRSALIEDIKVFSDALFPDLIEAIGPRLKGKAYSRAEASAGVLSLIGEFPELEREIKEIAAWLAQEIPY
ncbi:MAG: lipoate--protein ligase [Bdellovibrionales bacterium]|nr:lipoate--protein ligase [Bdellovibrionales bacterium]